MRTPRFGLAARLIALAVGLLALGQLVNIGILAGAERAWREARAEAVLVERMVQLSEATGAGPRGPRVLARRGGFELRRLPPRAGEPRPDLEAEIAARLAIAGEESPAIAVRMVEGRRGALLIAGIETQNGGWITTRLPVPGRIAIPWRFVVLQTLVLVVVLLPIAVYVGRRVSAPLKQLTEAADGLLSGRPSPPLPNRASPDVEALRDAFVALEARVMAALEERTVMLGALGHDLRTPLASLRIRIEEVEDTSLRDGLIESVERLSSALEDILAVSAGRPSGDDTGSVRSDALVRQLLRDYEGRPVRQGDVSPLTLPGSGETLLRALRNLVDNALDHGGGAVIEAREENGEAVLAVIDDGPGIPEAEIERLMRPFERGEDGAGRAHAGAGLGLPIARAAAAAHGGRLRLRNRVQGGLVAEIVLPFLFATLPQDLATEHQI
jgi:signal transduction histidine kinase